MTNIIDIKHSPTIAKLEIVQKIIHEIYEAEGTNNLFVHNALDRAEATITAVITELKSK